MVSSTPSGAIRTLRRRWHNAVRTDISITDRIGNGVVAGFIATFAMSVLHEPVALLTQAIGMRAPPVGLLFHFFVGTLLWGSVFGMLHDILPGPSWVRGTIFSAGTLLIVMLVVLPSVGAGWFGTRCGPFAPLVIAAFHLLYGATLGLIYGKLVDTDEAHEHEVGHLHH
jgi:hypothetical protein